MTYTILIADDYPGNIQIIVDALKSSDLKHKIIRAVNGKILCELAEKRLPDLIITDWEMPEMDGIEAIKYLSSIEATKDIPIIMCTGIMTSSENLKMALDSGAVDYIRKPIDSIELQSRVYSMLKLRNSYRTIKEQNAILEKQKEEIQTQRDELVIVNATKDKFFGIIAHDLRGPLGSLMGLTDIIANESQLLEPDEKKHIAVSLNHSVRNIYNLLENLLEWSQMQRQQTSFKPQILSLKNVLTGCIKIVTESAREKSIGIDLDIPDKIEVYADTNMLQTVIRNLASNAIKFTHNGGNVGISVKAYDTVKAVVSVKDTGIGMSKEMLNNLFRLDIKSNRPGTNGESSTGLGLLLCKEYAEKQGGKIWLESEAGKGSIFYFTIPFNAEKEKKNDIINTVSNDGAVDQVNPKGTGLKILIAEDDLPSEIILAAAVTMFGKEILRAKTGIEAVEICRNHPDIDLALMDIQMPVMDGYEATRQIRQFNKDVIIIAQTALGMFDVKTKTIEAGCNDYITKPIDKAELLSLIQKHFNK
ncbi:MAG: response regulator [Bacteroidetes bacterium]|nr:response regulator [Bacteroidota bacterium]